MPRGTRTSEPVSTGVAISRPNWVELRSSAFLIGMPITPNIIQTMKHTVKASVLTISTDQAFLSFRSSEAMFFLQRHGMTVGAVGFFRYPPVGHPVPRQTDDAATGPHRPEELRRRLNHPALMQINPDHA